MVIKGQFFEITSTGITVFDVSLSFFDMMLSLTLNEALAQLGAAENQSYLSLIEKLIQDDIDAGRDHLIDHVLVTPQVFCILVRDGVIAEEQMESVEEDLDEETITVSGVQFLGVLYKVKTMRSSVISARYDDDMEDKLNVATIDKDGEIV